jgi:hypothetical protein
VSVGAVEAALIALFQTTYHLEVRISMLVLAYSLHQAPIVRAIGAICLDGAAACPVHHPLAMTGLYALLACVPSLAAQADERLARAGVVRAVH